MSFDRLSRLGRYSKHGLKPIDVVLYRLGAISTLRISGHKIGGPDNANAWNLARSIMDGEYDLPGFQANPGDTVVDIGANIGLFSLLATRAGAAVTSYEAHPETFLHLRSNMRGLGVTCVHAAVVGKPSTDVTVRLFAADTPSRHNVVGKGVVDGAALHEFVTVPAIGIDSVLDDHCDLLKVDAEGAEFEIFATVATEALRRARRIIIEVHPSVGEPESVVARLRDAGFHVEVHDYGVELGAAFLVTAQQLHTGVNGAAVTNASNGQRLAHSDFSAAAAMARKVLFKTARVASHHPLGAPSRDFLWFKPAVRNTADLADLSARVNWYLPNRSVPIYVEAPADTSFRPQDAPHMDPRLVHDPGWSTVRPQGHPEIVYWRLTRELALDFAANCRHAEIVDWNLFHVSDRGWTRVLDRYGPLAPSTAATLDRLLARRVVGGRAFVLGTGPSAKLVDPSAVDAEIRIVCNSAVRDVELIEALKPDVIAFSDPVFHFAPNRYAATFRADLMRALDQTDAILVAHDHWAHILLAHQPELADRMVVLHPRKRIDWTWPERGNPTVRITGNVLTVIMLPVAFALADTVELAGCDGRKPDENYFWTHNKRTQYTDDLMNSAFEAHPAFFRDVDYQTVYEEHCVDLARIVAAAERDGKRVVPVTPSWIPVLRERGAPWFPSQGVVVS